MKLDDVLDRAAVLDIRDPCEDEDRIALVHAELFGDLGARRARLDGARAAVELVAEVALVRLEERAVVAEVELETPDEQVAIPDWLEEAIDREVTGDDAFSNRSLAQ